MKTKISVFVLLAAVFIILGTAAGSFAEEMPITGAYGDSNVNDADIVKAARSAVREAGQKQKATISLVSINKAQTQVVAGLNYKGCLTRADQKNSVKSGQKIRSGHRLPKPPKRSDANTLDYFEKSGRLPVSSVSQKQ